MWNPTRRKVLTHYRFLTTNSADSEVLKVKSLRLTNLHNVKSGDPHKKGKLKLTTDFSLIIQ